MHQGGYLPGIDPDFLGAVFVIFDLYSVISMQLL
jgi:hypothetical protein